jgi:hypothetical protein
MRDTRIVPTSTTSALKYTPHFHPLVVRCRRMANFSGNKYISRFFVVPPRGMANCQEKCKQGRRVLYNSREHVAPLLGFCVDELYPISKALRAQTFSIVLAKVQSFVNPCRVFAVLGPYDIQNITGFHCISQHLSV